MIENIPCGRNGITHVVEQVYPGSSTQRRGNCPNHRSYQYWFVSDVKGGFTGQRSMQTGFVPAAASRGVSSGGQDHGGQGGQNHRTHQPKYNKVHMRTGGNGHPMKSGDSGRLDRRGRR